MSFGFKRRGEAEAARRGEVRRGGSRGGATAARADIMHQDASF